MTPCAVQLVFAPPAWPVLLVAAAAAVLCWEVMSLASGLRTGRSAVAAAALTGAALIAGPLVALAAMLGRVFSPPDPTDPRQSALSAGLRGSLLVALGAATWLWRPGGAPAGAVVALAAAAAIWAVRSYHRTTSPLRRRAQGVLLGLRIATILLLGLWTLQPALEYLHDEYIRGVLLIGIDTSSSMQRRDMPPRYQQTRLAPGEEPIPRIQAVLQAMRDQAPALEDLADQADVEVFTFAAAAGPTAKLPSARVDRIFRAPVADGPATAIGDAAAAAYHAAAFGGEGGLRRDVAGIVLISDGCNNTSETVPPETLAAQMGSRSVPLYTVGAGSETVTASTRTLDVRDLAVPDEVEAFNRLPIAARIETVGLTGRTVTVTCRFGDKTVGTERIAVTGTRLSHPLRFSHIPLASGYQRLTVEAKCEGKPVRGLAGRTRASKLVHVVDRDMRILYVEGTFRYESKYIARALAAGRRFALDRRVLLRPAGARQDLALPETLDDWLGYHAVVFGDVAASHFTTKQMEIVRDLVGTYGKGFCMIGGEQSFGAGKWAGTPIADLLPVDPARSTGSTREEVKARPTAEGLKAELLRIGEDDNVAAAWMKLPVLSGTNLLGGVKLGATVLAEGPKGEPLIVAQPYGAGRSLAIAFDTTWRWVLTPEDTAEMQQRFWRQVALYLAAPKGNVWVVTDKTSYDSRRLEAGLETIDVTAGVEDPRGRPLPDAPVTVTLTHLDSQTAAPVQVRSEGPMRRGRLTGVAAAGLYELRITASVAGKEIAATHRFEIIRRDLEAREALANLALLREMAAASEGHFVELARFPGLIEKLRIASRPKKRVVATYNELGRTLRWPVVALLIVLLCAEWALRKRRGLV